MKATTSPLFHAAPCAVSTPRIAASSEAPACAMPQVRTMKKSASAICRYLIMCTLGFVLGFVLRAAVYGRPGNASFLGHAGKKLLLIQLHITILALLSDCRV